MSTYQLLEHFEDMTDKKKSKEKYANPEADYNRNIFKDKKLNKLWMKAERAGFTSSVHAKSWLKYHNVEHKFMYIV